MEKTVTPNAHDETQDNFKLTLDLTVKPNADMNDSYRILPLVSYSNEESKSGDIDETKEIMVAEDLEKALLTSDKNLDKSSQKTEIENLPNNLSSNNLHQMCSTFNPNAVLENNSQA